MKTEIVNNASDLKEKIEKYGVLDYFYFVSEDRRIDALIEDSRVDDDLLLDLRLSYDFTIDGFLEIGGNVFEVISIKNLVETLEETNFNADDKLVLNINDKTLIAKTIQQLLYLNLSLKVVSSDELKKVKIKKNFDEQKSYLRQQLSDFQISVLNYDANEGKDLIENNKKELVDSIEKISRYIENLEDRKYKIAVMATKKTGKSVIVNSILGEEYAPTSIELPTPNNIIYEGWDREEIEVRILSDLSLIGYEKEEIRIFHTKNDVKKYLNQLFKTVEKDISNNYTMPDIEIRYPINKKSKKSANYIVIDTPGPDLAGSGHEGVAYRQMKDVDVVIFAMDYSKYLTKVETQFLDDLKKELSSKGKFHSLMVTLNKLDLRYDNEGSKSVTRVLDFIKGKLKNLDRNFEDIVVMGTSSLQYFRMLGYIELLGENIDDLLDEKVETLIKKTNPRELNTEQKTIRSFIKTQLNHLEDFHYLEDVTVKKFLEHSGMPYLLDRMDYIAGVKAGEEIFNNIFSKIEVEFNKIETKFLIEKVEEIRNKAESLKKDIEDIREFFNKKKIEIENLNSVEKLKYESEIIVKENIDGFKIKAFETVENNISNYIYDVKEGKSVEIGVKEFLSNFNTKMKDEWDSLLSQINKKKDEYVQEMENNIQNLNNDIKNNIKEKDFENKYNFKIKLREIDPSLAKQDFKLELKIDFTKNLVDSLVTFDTVFDNNEYVVKRDGLIGKIRDIGAEKLYSNKDLIESKVGSDFFNVITNIFNKKLETRIELNEDKLSLKKQELISEFNGIIEDRIETISNSLIEKLNSKFVMFKNIIDNEITSIINSYENSNREIMNYLEGDENKISEVKKFLGEVKDNFTKMNKNWQKIKSV